MTADNILNKMLQPSSIPAKCSKSQRLQSPATPFTCVLRAREPHLKWPAAKPEPMFSGSGEHRNPFIADSCIQIHVTDAFEKLLLQKPLLHPGEGRIIILHRDNHGALADDPVP